MKTIALLSCVKKKRHVRSLASDLYVNTLFKFSYKYAMKRNVDRIYILSAKYGILHPNTEVDPYEVTLNNMSASEIKKWGVSVLAQLRHFADLSGDRFLILAGEKYRRELLPAMANYKIPMEGLGLGQQMAWLKKQVTS